MKTAVTYHRADDQTLEIRGLTRDQYLEIEKIVLTADQFDSGELELVVGKSRFGTEFRFITTTETDYREDTIRFINYALDENDSLVYLHISHIMDLAPQLFFKSVPGEMNPKNFSPHIAEIVRKIRRLFPELPDLLKHVYGRTFL